MINFEKKHSMERVVGVDKKEKEAIKEVVAEEFEKQDIADIKGIELEKTPEEIQIIDLVNEETNKLLARYDLPKFDIPPKNVHLLDRESYRKIRGLRDTRPGSAHFDPKHQTVLLGKRESRVAFAKEIFHEFIHFKSYQAAQRTLEGDLDLYRVGLTVYSRDGKRRYFSNLNDAVTEELSKRFYFQKIKNDPFFKEEVEEIEKVRKIFLAKAKTDKERKDAMDIARLEPKKEKNIKGVFSFSFQREREVLNNLLDKLYEQNREDFRDREEIFELFTKSMLSGNLLPIGKLIDRAFGKGTFRKIGELDDNIEEQSKFVQNL